MNGSISDNIHLPERESDIRFRAGLKYLRIFDARIICCKRRTRRFSQTVREPQQNRMGRSRNAKIAHRRLLGSPRMGHRRPATGRGRESDEDRRPPEKRGLRLPRQGTRPVYGRGETPREKPRQRPRCHIPNEAIRVEYTRRFYGNIAGFRGVRYFFCDERTGIRASPRRAAEKTGLRLQRIRRPRRRAARTLLSRIRHRRFHRETPPKGKEARKGYRGDQQEILRRPDEMAARNCQIHRKK